MTNNAAVATGTTRVPVGVLRDAIYKCRVCHIGQPHHGAVMFDVWCDHLVLVASDNVGLIVVKLVKVDADVPSKPLRLARASLRQLWNAVKLPGCRGAVFNWESKQCQIGDTIIELKTNKRTPPPWREAAGLALTYNAWFTASALRDVFAGLRAAHCERAICSYERTTKQLQVESHSTQLQIHASCDAVVHGTDSFAFGVNVNRMYTILQRVGCERVKVGKDWRQPLVFCFSGGIAFLMPIDPFDVRFLWRVYELHPAE